MKKIIPFNKPCLTGNEFKYISDAIETGHLSGNGSYSKKCHSSFEEKYGFTKTLLTTSCTDGLEMCALLANIQPLDEVIVPSFTFVSTALAFVRQGAKIVFADSHKDQPGIDEDKIEGLITPKTKVIVPVHYAGVACDMDKIMMIADKYNLIVIEDAAQAIDSFYKGRPLGGIGHLGVFSFHETKNVNAGEGGLLIVNDERFIKRSEILWEKGTNRADYFRGEINKYSWVDVGSSFLPSELISAFLYAQLENLEMIQQKRKKIWNMYFEGLAKWALKNNYSLPQIPDYATCNGHMFYLVCPTEEKRDGMISHLKKNDIHAVFHYQSLHRSPFYEKKYSGVDLHQSDKYSNCLLRLPLYYELEYSSVKSIIYAITHQF